jgi:DNA-binding transcriptional LysR family regulator
MAELSTKDAGDPPNRGKLNVAFLLKPQTHIEGLIIEPLLREPFQVVAPADHPFTHLPQITPADMQGVTIIVTEMLDVKYHSVFESMRIPAGRSTLLSFNSAEAIKQCVLAGMGIGVVPKVAVQPTVGRLRSKAHEGTGARSQSCCHDAPPHLQSRPTIPRVQEMRRYRSRLLNGLCREHTQCVEVGGSCSLANKG